jgi:hypothetical protein
VVWTSACEVEDCLSYVHHTVICPGVFGGMELSFIEQFRISDLSLLEIPRRCLQSVQENALIMALYRHPFSNSYVLAISGHLFASSDTKL